MNRTVLATVWPPTRAVAVEAGHEQMSPVQAIRRKCLDCSGQKMTEVKLCETVTCAIWLSRAGKHPYTKTRLLEADSEQRASSGTPEHQLPPSPEIGLLGAAGEQGGHEHGYCRSSFADGAADREQQETN